MFYLKVEKVENKVINFKRQIKDILQDVEANYRVPQTFTFKSVIVQFRLLFVSSIFCIKNIFLNFVNGIGIGFS